VALQRAPGALMITGAFGGFSASGLPIGPQISAAHFAEITVIALAHAYEQATEWHSKRPKL